MQGRLTDHVNLNLTELNREVIRGTSKGKIIWQPRILCWYGDREFSKEPLPQPYTGMTPPQLYRTLGCSNRIYDYNSAILRIEDSAIHRYSKAISEYEIEYFAECPSGKISTIQRSNTSNYGVFPKKWWITSEEDMKVAIWIEEHTTFKFDQKEFDKQHDIWGDLGLPSLYVPRVNIQSLFIDTMGVEEGIYALVDYKDTVEAYFKVLDKSSERYIDIINNSPFEIVNFGDNLHGGILSPDLFKKYVLPTYQRRNELLHKKNKFTNAHWDGDTKVLLPFAKECGLDGIEAITPVPQGDVTLDEMKEALGDDIFLMDGIPAILFDKRYSEELLIETTKKVIELFAPKLILGISDEMSSTGEINRVKLVGEIVDDYNASL